MDQPPRVVTINMSTIPVAGLGGVGMLALVVIMAASFDQARWLLILGTAGGAVLGAGKWLMLRRHGPWRASSGVIHC